MTMARMDDLTAASIVDLLNARLAEHPVLGCGLAVALDGQVFEFAAGVADARTGEPMRPNTLCLIGSTTKVYTATLVMQLVDEGRVALDAPVRRYLPDLQLADEEAASSLTIRHLLSHKSGLGVGDYADDHRDDWAVARYVSRLVDQPSVHAPGERWGYSNVAFVIAGRVVEAVTGLPWDDVLEQRLLRPAGLHQSSTRSEELLLHPIAKPHIRLPSGAAEVAPRWGVAGRALGPTGSTLAASAGDLVRFANIHLQGGLAPDGTRLIAAESVAALQQRHSRVPDGWPYGDGWCLGWSAATWKPHQVVGHTGHNLGAGSHLILLPDMGAAFALVFNTEPGDATFAHEVLATLAQELFATQKPPPWLPEAAHPPANLHAYVGTYTNDLGRLVVEQRNGSLILHSDLRMPMVGENPSVLRPVSATAFGSGRLGSHAAASPTGFLTPELFFDGWNDAGQPEFLYQSVFPFRRDRANIDRAPWNSSDRQQVLR